MRLTLILILICSFLSAEPREALLIGNHIYKHKNVSNLNDPLENLKKLKKTLEELDFTVEIKTNLNSENLEEAIELFAKRLARNANTIGFLYYTGHGCQVERQGYLLPTNVDSAKRIKVKHNALKINEMIETLKESGNRVNMFFLDACRDVPVGTKGNSKGLGQIKNTPKGTLVVYATKDGETAEDNSDFINSIISSVKEPQQSIRNLPYSISDVFKHGSTSQTPIFLALDIPKVVLNSRGGYVPPKPIVLPVEPVYVPQPVVVKSKIHSTKNTVTIDGLMYQNELFTKKYNWQESKDYCEGLTLGNYTNWRLPRRNELSELITVHSLKDLKGYTHYMHKDFIESLSRDSSFWTSTIDKYCSCPYSIDFNYPKEYGQNRSNPNYVLCVR
jgi:hypothetical protein